jgi:heavy metal efflux system protein
MHAFGLSANLMSLGAIDFGMIVDGAIVMMENSVHRLESDDAATETPLESIRLAAREVARPMSFAVAIIIAVYLPILFLQGLEGRVFRPMAITVCGALLGSLLLALTAIPVFASYAFRKGISEKQKERDTHGWMARLNQAILFLQELEGRVFRPMAITGFSTEAMGINEGDTYVLPKPIKDGSDSTRNKRDVRFL